MIDKKRMHFMQLALFFIAITAVVLTQSWMKDGNTSKEAGMMNQGMGNLMSSMHLSEVSLNALFKQEEQMEAASSTSIQHHEQSGYLKDLHFVTTATIVILLPLIVAGVIFLAVSWIR